MSKVKYNQLLRSQPDDSLIIFFNLRLYHSNTGAVPPHDVVPPVQEHLQYSTVQYSTVQYSTVQYSTGTPPVQYSTVQYSTSSPLTFSDSTQSRRMQEIRPVPSIFLLTINQNAFNSPS